MQLVWDELEDRVYETGIDRGVLYVDGLDGVAWNGIINITETPSGGEARPLYIDGVKYLNLSAGEEFEANITAFYSPKEFDLCDGSIAIQPGVFANHQMRRPFCFSFRTKVGNAGAGQDAGYKIHIVYNAMALPTIRSYRSFAEASEAINLSWRIVTRSIPFPNLSPTAHITLDSTKLSPEAVAALEAVLYGSELEDPRVPMPEEILDLASLTSEFLVVDNGDGTYSMEGSTDHLVDHGDGTFTIVEDALDNEDGTFTLTT